MVSVKLQVSVHQIFHTSRTKDWICLPLADGYCSQLSLQKNRHDLAFCCLFLRERMAAT